MDGFRLHHVMTGAQNCFFQGVHHHDVMAGAKEFFVPKRYTVIMWWQVHENFWLVRVCPHHVMTDTQELFALQHPPSLRDDRCTRFFVPKWYTVITWWQIHKNFWFERVCPHHLMTDTQELLFHNIHPHRVMTGVQEFLFLKGTPSSRDIRSTRIFGSRGSALIVFNFYSTAYGASCVSPSSSTHEFWKLQYDMMIEVQFMRRSTLAKNDEPSQWRRKR